MTEMVDVPQKVAEETAFGGPADEFAPLSRGTKFFGFVCFLFMIAAAAAFLVQLPLLVLEPGNTFETESFIEVDGADSFESPGEVSFVTVHQRRLTPVDWLVSQFQSSDEIFHEDVLLGGRTIEEQREENAQLMISSQNLAITAALDHLGFDTAEPAGVVIVDVVPGGVLDGVLARNDVITEVNGVPVLTADELFDVIAEFDADETLTIVAGRPGEDPETLDLSLTDDTSGFLGIARDPADADDQGAVVDEVVEGGPTVGILEADDRIVGLDGASIDSFGALVEALSENRAGDTVAVDVVRVADGEESTVNLEVTLGTRAFERAGISFADTQFRDAELPLDVSFTTDNIGGPSAGLAFSLSVLDVLTEGDLTGGANIVVTGAIDRFGNVTSIGGAHQKAFAAQDVGADVFIVPDGNLEEAQAAVPELRIESVSSLTEALDIIAEFGGNVDQLPVDGQL